MILSLKINVIFIFLCDALRVCVRAWCPENVKVFEWTILLYSATNMVTIDERGYVFDAHSHPHPQ